MSVKISERSDTLRRFRDLGLTQKEIIDAYHILEYELGVAQQIAWANTSWLGYRMLKLPTDMFLYAELLWELKPSLVIETGTLYGGSALFLATTMDAYGVGKVLTIDILKHTNNLPTHPRIAYLPGKSSVDPKVLEQVQAEVDYRGGNVLVILDSDHRQAHVAEELEAYSQFVSPGSWLVVEDTNLDGRPIQQYGTGPGNTDEPGPWFALEDWLPKNPAFKVDDKKEFRYLHSQHTWIRRLRT